MSPDPLIRAEILQRLRVDATRFVLHSNLSDEEQGETLQVIKACEILLPALAQELSELGKPLKPPNAVLHFGREPWEKRLTLDRLLNLDQKYPSFVKEYAEDSLPLHRVGEPLRLRHIEAGEYSCLKRALEILLDDSERKLAETHSNAVREVQKAQDSPQGKGKRNRGPEHGKDAEEIGVAQAAAVPQHARQMLSVAQKGDKSKTKAARGPTANMDYHRAVTAIVKRFGDDWREISNLEEIAVALDRDKVGTPPPKIWADRNPPALRWERAVEYYPELVRKALAYSLDMNSRDISN